VDREVRCEGKLLMRAGLLLGALLLVGCGQQAADVPKEVATTEPPLITHPMPASVETLVADNPTVDADDPVLWADKADPSRALWIGTDKSKGLYVHDMSGKMLQFFPDGPMNNVDLRDAFTVSGKAQVLVAAAERERFGIMTWLLDPATLKLSRYGFLPTDKAFGEPYGFCMGRFGGETFLVANNKDGVIQAHAVSAGPSGPQMVLRHSFKLGTQTEGCVVNDETGDLYVGEEDVGIWRMSLATPAAPPVKIAGIDNRILTADVEGLTLMRDAGQTYLIASSQGDNSYPVWRLENGGYALMGRFKVQGGSIDPVTMTDGLDAWSGPIAGYPEGAIAMHDHCDGEGPQDPPATVCDSDTKQQNYKLVDWRDVKAALGIK